MEKELTFEEILKQQKKTGVKRKKKVVTASSQEKDKNDEAPIEMSSKRPKKMNKFYEKQSYSCDPRYLSKNFINIQF